MTIKLLTGDCRATLPTLAAGSVQAVITSPPYYGLRDYGTPPLVWGGIEHEHEWAEPGRAFHPGQVPQTKWANVSAVADGGRAHSGQCCPCGAWLGSLGLEPTPDLFIEHLVEVFREVKRVLRDDGCLFLNLGDSYADKNLLMMPFRVAIGLQNDGWYLRSVIPWLKRNSMPESVTDRPATAVEYIFLLSKASKYFWDADSVRVSAVSLDQQHPSYRTNLVAISENGRKEYHAKNETSMRNYNTAGRNRRNSDWFFESWQGLMLDEQDDSLALVVNPAPFTGSHFATFPPKLVEPMVKASTRTGDTVLDCFSGAGTVGLVADRLQRNAILCELKPEYADMGSARITNDAPMFADVEGGRDAPPTGKVTDKQGASGLRRYTGFNARWDAKKKDA